MEKSLSVNGTLLCDQFLWLKKHPTLDSVLSCFDDRNGRNKGERCV